MPARDLFGDILLPLHLPWLRSFRFGRPGVECYCQHESGAAVIQLQFLINEVGYVIKSCEIMLVFKFRVSYLLWGSVKKGSHIKCLNVNQRYKLPPGLSMSLKTNLFMFWIILETCSISAYRYVCVWLWLSSSSSNKPSGRWRWF